MKARTIFPIALVAAVAALVAAGCAAGGVGTQTGNLTFRFAASARGAGDSYRIEVYYGDARMPAATAESNASDEVQVPDLPAGDATVYVAKGSGAGSSFVATNVGKADVRIVAGDNTATVTLAPVSFTLQLGATSVKAVAATGGKVLIAKSDDTLAAYTASAGTLTEAASPSNLPQGMVVRSLTPARFFSGEANVAQIWVNGSWDPVAGGGIVPWDPTSNTLGGSFSAGFVNGFGTGVTPVAINVESSGSFIETAADSVAVFYRYGRGLGGIYLDRANTARDKATWPWIMVDLTDALAGALQPGQEPILDIAVSSDAVYLVTVVTTLKLSKSVLTDASVRADAAKLLDPASHLAAFASGISGTPTTIALTTDKVYLGTPNGLWVGGIANDATKFFADASPATAVPGTSGHSARRIAVSAGGNVAYVIGSSGAPDELGVLTSGAAAPAYYRSIEGLPGETINDVAWADDSTLLVAGNAGLAVLTVAP
jgi:hypothetical protein